MTDHDAAMRRHPSQFAPAMFPLLRYSQFGAEFTLAQAQQADDLDEFAEHTADGEGQQWTVRLRTHEFAELQPWRHSDYVRVLALAAQALADGVR